MEAVDAVGGFLSFRQNEDFCDPCLANSLRLTTARVTAAATVLGASGGYLRDRWKCSRCGVEGPVTRGLANRVIGPVRRLRAA
jgi:hypothetical protein